MIYMLLLRDQNRNAQVAELVDALVSNTNGANRAGSSPALGTKKALIFESFLYLATLLKSKNDNRETRKI